MQDIWKQVTTEPWLEQEDNLEASLAGEAKKARHPDFIIKWEALWDVIRRYLPSDPETPVLDIGGGAGVWTLRLAEAGHRVLFTEISEANSMLARHRAEAAGLSHRIDFGVADVRDLGGFEPGRYPLVLALGNVLGLSGVVGEALREIARLVPPGGVLIGEVENRYRHLAHRLRAQSWADAKRLVYDGIGRRPYAGGVMPHRQFTVHEIRNLLTETGWEVLEMYPSRLATFFLPARYIEEARAADGSLDEVIELEKHLRQDPTLLGCGQEIQFVVRLPG